MKLLYFDRWRVSPRPVSFPGCLTVEVLDACTPGGENGILGIAEHFELFRNILKYRRRALKRAFRYFQVIGGRRTLAKIRSNVLACQSQLGQSVAAIAGVVTEVHGNGQPSAGSKVAGYRTDHPLYAELVLVHPDQVTDIPEGVSMEDAATVFYYALALEMSKRIDDISRSTSPIVCGDTLPCMFLRQFLRDMGKECLWVERPDRKNISKIENAVRKGALVVAGTKRWFERLNKDLLKKRIYLMGLNAEMLAVPEWNELKPRWIGVPHSAVCNVNIFSQLPLELPPYLCSKGLQEALLDMTERKWSPSAYLTKYDASGAEEGDEISLATCYSIIGTKRLNCDGRVVVRGKSIGDRGGGILRVGFIGLGMWARGNLIPFLLRDKRVRLVIGADQDPIRLQQAADLFGIPAISSDPDEIISSDQIDAVFICTWHDSHAKLAAQAIRAGKKVFVEKPLALDYDQLANVASALREHARAFLAVGYNRVHSDVTKLLKKQLATYSGPITFTAIVREPTIHRTHYYYWPHQGPRIVSNGCHWIDYAFHLLLPRIPCDIRSICALGPSGGDNSTIVMRYEDGSVASLTFADRGESLIGGNELIDIKSADCQYMIRDFTTFIRYEEGRVSKVWKSNADRGWESEMRNVVDSMVLGIPPRSYREIFQSSSLIIEAMHSYKDDGEPRLIHPPCLELDE